MELVRHAVLIIGMLVLAGWALTIPTSAHAQESYVCSDPIVGNLTPYIYEGELDSFEYTIEDTEKHLPFLVTIDGKDVPLHYITVWDEKNPGYRTIHVDVPFSDLDGDTSIFISMVQITDGSVPPCVTTAVFTVALPVTISTTQNPPHIPGDNTGDVTDTPVRDGEDEDTETPVVGGEADTECESAALSVWIKLAVLSVVIALVALVYMPTIARSNELLVGVILVPLIILLGLWYVFDGCREFVWFPFSILLVSLGVLAASSMPFFLTGGFGPGSKKGKSKTMTLDEMLDKLKETFEDTNKKKGGSNRGAITTVPPKFHTGIPTKPEESNNETIVLPANATDSEVASKANPTQATPTVSQNSQKPAFENQNRAASQNGSRFHTNHRTDRPKPQQRVSQPPKPQASPQMEHNKKRHQDPSKGSQQLKKWDNKWKNK